jgi:hypothetical protein
VPEGDPVDYLLVEMRFSDPPGNPVSERGSRNKVKNSQLTCDEEKGIQERV